MNPQRRRVVVSGLGLVSPHGDDPARCLAALLEGRSAIARRPIGEGAHSTTIVSAACADFDAPARFGRPRANTMDRNAQLGLAAAMSAWGDAGLDAMDPGERERTPLHWGTGAGGAASVERGYNDLFVKGRPRVSPLSVVQSMHNAAAAHIGLELRLGGPSMTYSVACASGAIAIGEAALRIRSGACDIALAGGSEAALPYGPVKAWQSLQVLAEPRDDADDADACAPFDRDRRGLVLGEGAAALVLEDLEHARARGARIYAELAGFGCSSDHHNLVAPHAAGQVRALHAALHDAAVPPNLGDYVNAHGTGTLDGDATEVAALLQVFGPHASRVAVSSTKSMHGHLMGAAGALEALITVLAVQAQALPPTASLRHVAAGCIGLDHVRTGRSSVHSRVALSNSFAFGGTNAVLVIKPV